MRLYKISNLQEYQSFLEKTSDQRDLHNSFLNKHVPEEQVEFRVPGYSYTAQKAVDFLVDYQHSGNSGIVNWRERVQCPETYFNNRMRATFHLFDIFMDPYEDKKIYISEQLTPIYDYFLKRFPGTIGSEFLGPSLAAGSMNEAGIRNEDLTSLSFANDSFDAIVSLDVFEHIPEYKRAFNECARILKSGGKMMWSVPFNAEHDATTIRAKIVNGKIEHIHPPEYHGDPLSPDGVLCFQDFGWEMFQDVKNAGFGEAYAIYYQSAEFGYLGQGQFMFFASKEGNS